MFQHQVAAKSVHGGQGGWGVGGGGWGLGGLVLSGSNSLGQPEQEEAPIWSKPVRVAEEPGQEVKGQEESLPPQQDHETVVQVTKACTLQPNLKTLMTMTNNCDKQL